MRKTELLARYRAAPLQSIEHVKADPPREWLCSCLENRIWRKRSEVSWSCYRCHPPADLDPSSMELATA